MMWWTRAVLVLVLVACRGDSASLDAPLADVTLSPVSGRHVGHTYSPDGKHVVYWSPATDSAGPWQLWVANADLSEPRKLAVTSANPDPSPWSPDGARIAASSNQYGAADVVVVAVATGLVQRVTLGAGVETPQGWSSDGNILSYFRTSPDGSFRVDLLSMSDGTSRPLAPGQRLPTLGAPSPDGSHVAYTVFDGSKSTIWVADSVGSNARQLTTEGFENLEWTQEWSPDGTLLLYESTRTGTTDLWLVPVDGGTPRQLTRNVRNDFAGAWSPNGKWIAFISDRGRQTDVWVVSAAGGEEHRVTNSAAEEQRPLIWRAGSNELTFGVKGERSALWAFDVASGTERRLTADSLRVSDWSVSPDGAQLSVIVERGGGVRDLALVPVAGGPMRTLVSGDASIARPLFSPDGSKIVYGTDREGSSDIWVVPMADGTPRSLVNWPSLDNYPVWSEDGSTILFLSDKEARLADVWSVSVSGGEPTRITNDGGLIGLLARAGVAGAFADRLSAQGGQIGLVQLGANGRIQTVWDRSNVTAYAPHSVDSVAAIVEQPDGKGRSMLLSTSGGGGRVILKPTETLLSPSYDGTFLLFKMPVNGASDLGMLNLANGSVRRLTTTRDAETSAEFTRDGKTVVFRRAQMVQRIHAVDLSKVIAERKE